MKKQFPSFWKKAGRIPDSGVNWVLHFFNAETRRRRDQKRFQSSLSRGRGIEGEGGTSHNALAFKNEPFTYLRCALLTASLIALAGCGREDIRVYTVPKAPAPQQEEVAADVQPHLHWELPANWEPRAGFLQNETAFLVSLKNEKTATASYVPFPSMVGSEDLIINIFREQIGLPPLTPEEAEAITSSVSIDGIESKLYLLDDENSETAPVTLLAMTHFGTNSTWLFKLTADSSSIEEARPSYMQFLESVEFDVGGHEPMNVASSAPPATSPGLPQWTVPENWESVDPGTVLLASFDIDDSANVTVSRFPGDVGGLLANLNRWRGQIGLSPIPQNELAGAAPEIELEAGTGNLIDISQPEGAGRQRIIAIILPRNGQSWFYKIQGDYQTVEESRAAFVEFARTANYEGI